MRLSLIKRADGNADAALTAQAEQPEQVQAEPRFSLTECAGRLIEISGMGGSAVLSAAAGLVLEAQEREEPVAWVTSLASSFYPPDLDEAGIDLAKLIVARGEPKKLTAMTDLLARSGGFGLIVIDGVIGGDLPLATQTRLLGLAQKHETAIVFLTEKPAEAPSLGSLVSLRGQASRRRNGEAYQCEVKILKDKRRGPTWRHVEVRRGSTGLR